MNTIYEDPKICKTCSLGCQANTKEASTGYQGVGLYLFAAALVIILVGIVYRLLF